MPPEDYPQDSLGWSERIKATLRECASSDAPTERELEAMHRAAQSIIDGGEA